MEGREVIRDWSAAIIGPHIARNRAVLFCYTPFGVGYRFLKEVESDGESIGFLHSSIKEKRI
jgi:hypothetical protein